MTRIGLLCVVLTALGGCVTVKPWEREQLSKACMTVRMGEDGLAGAYTAKVIETTTGGGLPGDAPGGGCGCSQ